MKKFKFYTTAEIEQILESKNEIDSDYQWSIYSNQQKLHTWFRELLMAFHIARVNISRLKMNEALLKERDKLDLRVPQVIRINGGPCYAFRSIENLVGFHVQERYDQMNSGKSVRFAPFNQGRNSQSDTSRNRALKRLGWETDWLLDFYGVPQAYLILSLWFMPHKTLKEIAEETPFSYSYVHRMFIQFEEDKIVQRIPSTAAGGWAYAPTEKAQYEFNRLTSQTIQLYFSRNPNNRIPIHRPFIWYRNSSEIIYKVARFRHSSLQISSLVILENVAWSVQGLTVGYLQNVLQLPRKKVNDALRKLVRIKFIRSRQYEDETRFLPTKNYLSRRDDIIKSAWANYIETSPEFSPGHLSIS